jgi:23S rRNA-/tRNA-specific pseudouridylate synthase
VARDDDAGYMILSKPPSPGPREGARERRELRGTDAKRQRRQKVEPLIYVATQRMDQNTSGLLAVVTKGSFQ